MSSNFVIYLLGYIVIAAGVAFGMSAIGLSQTWIITVMLIFAGIGIIGALSRSKKSDMADAKVDQTEQQAYSS